MFKRRIAAALLGLVTCACHTTGAREPSQALHAKASGKAARAPNTGGNAATQQASAKDVPGRCRTGPDLAGRPLLAAEIEPAELARSWSYRGRTGPGRPAETYRFIADSGLVDAVSRGGFNAVVLTAGFDVTEGPEADFQRLVAAFAKAGIGVVASVPLHEDLSDDAPSLAALACRDGLAGFRVDAPDGEETAAAVDGLAEALREARPGLLVLGPRKDELTRRLSQALPLAPRQLDMTGLRDALAAAPATKLAVPTVSLAAHAQSALPYVASRLPGADGYYVERKTMAFGALALLAGDADVELLQTRLLQTGSLLTSPAVDWPLLAREGPRMVHEFFSGLARLVRAKAAFRPAAAAIWSVDTQRGRRIVILHRRDTATGSEVYAVVNLSHVGLSLYQLGVDARGGPFRVVFDGDAAALGGSGELAHRLPDGIVVADGRLTLPYLAPYSTVVLERQ